VSEFPHAAAYISFLLSGRPAPRTFSTAKLCWPLHEANLKGRKVSLLGRFYPPKQYMHMKYFDEIDAWLADLLLPDDDEHTDDQTREWFANAKKEIKAELLESYRNGQRAGLRPKEPAGQKNRWMRKDTAQEEPQAPPARRPWPPRRSSQR
jgi:hypothetical protein